MNAAVNFHLFLTFASIRVEEKKENFSNSEFFQSFADVSVFFSARILASDDNHDDEVEMEGKNSVISSVRTEQVTERSFGRFFRSFSCVN